MTRELYLKANSATLAYLKGKKLRVIKALRHMAKNGPYTIESGRPYYHGICNNLQFKVEEDGGKFLDVYYTVEWLFKDLPLANRSLPIKGYDTAWGWVSRTVWCGFLAKVLSNPTKAYRIPDELVKSLGLLGEDS